VNAKIEELIPGAVYRDRTYTQTVVVRLRDGTHLRLEDSTMRCGETHLGEEVEITVSADIAESVEQLSAGTVKMEPTDVEIGPGIDELETRVQEVRSVAETKITVLLALPSGELEYTFNTVQLPDSLPENYEPAVGDWLRFKGISNPHITSVSTRD